MGFKKKIINRYWLMLIIEAASMIFAAIMHAHYIARVLFIIGMIVIVLATVEMCFELKFLRITSVVCGAIATISGILWFMPVGSSQYHYLTLLIGVVFYSLFFFIATIAIDKHVFTSNRINLNVIVGSICVYIMIGLCFVYIYTTLCLVLGGSFNVSGVPLEVKPIFGKVGLREFLYFSFSTLTTTGFGDIVPQDPLTRMTSYFESIVGSLYLAIVVAKLIGMYVTRGIDHNTKPNQIQSAK